MNKIICGELIYENKHYYFDFRNNIIVLQPDKMDDNYIKWYLNNLDNSMENDSKEINVEGETNEGKYICFINVKFQHLGRGALRAFVPAYILGITNLVCELPKCDNITQMIFKGESLDTFCNPKRIIKTNDIYSEKSLKIELENNAFVKKYTIDKNIHEYIILGSIPNSFNLNNVLNVEGQLKVIFNESKNINEIISYYINIEKFFCFINNRRIVKFSSIKLKQDGKLIDNSNNIKFEFLLYITETDREVDLLNNINGICLDDIEENYEKLFKAIIKKDFLTYYYPLNKKEDVYISNDKYIQISSAFESEFRKLFPNFKTSINDNYKDVKNKILKNIYNQEYKLKTYKNKLSTKEINSKVKYCKYFLDIINDIDGTLEEKICYVLKRYKDILSKKKKELLESYNVENRKDTVLAKKFSERRNHISHGDPTDKFDASEIIAYVLLKMCIYCLVLERCDFSFENIDNIINKIFK